MGLAFTKVGSLKSQFYLRQRIQESIFAALMLKPCFKQFLQHANFAEQARLCTRIVNDDGIGLETIEHIMAAFAGIGLDNAVVEINAPEAPILDGSSAPYLVALQNVGLEKATSRKEIY